MIADQKNKDRNDNKDSLKEITGIGPDYERALNEIGVLTFAQLAEFRDAQQLHKALEKSGIEINLWKIEKYDWIDQARIRVKKQKAFPAVEEVVVSKREPNQALPTKPWKEYAAFIVTFDRHIYEDNGERWRTRVYKTENGDEIEFDGTNPSPWTKWIYEQAKLPIVETHVDESLVSGKSVHSETELVVTHVPAAKIGKQMKIVDVRVVSPSKAIPRTEIMVRVHFEILGSEVEVWTKERASYRLELYLLDLKGQVTKPAASTQKRLEPGILEYEIGEVIPIPSPGRYELYVLLFSLPPAEMIVAHRGPTINVVPHPVSAL